MGSKGLNSFGNKHARPNLWYMFDFSMETLDITLEIGEMILENLSNKEVTLVWAIFIFLPNCMTGLGQERE